MKDKFTPKPECEPIIRADQKAQDYKDLDPKWGLCESCTLADSDGEHGEIACCNSEEELSEDAQKLADKDLLGQSPAYQCSNWIGYKPYFCNKHKHWNDGSYPSCEECMDEQSKENEMGNPPSTQGGEK